MRFWHFWQDKIRQAIYKAEVEEHYQQAYNIELDYTHAMRTNEHGRVFFPEVGGDSEKQFRPKAHLSSIGFVNDTLALFRWVFYRPIPDLVWRKHRFTFSSLAVLATVLVAIIFVVLYCFLKQPLFWESIEYGSPCRHPLRHDCRCHDPWIIATSMKANLLTVLIGIGPERLNVFHRWAGYICLFMSLVHAVPFYIQPVWNDDGMAIFQRLFPGGSGIIYGTGIACLVPLVWLCVASLPFIRRIAYELFVILHVPVGAVYIGVLFWHTKNFLMSWSYLYTSVAIWVVCYLMRFFNLNWVRPWRLAFMVGDEAAITLMSENAIKITIPTQMRWKPGQYVYLRMPGISLFENHPFTIASLCSDDFPSDYGDEYRDCVVVFKPYGGFTRRVLETAIEKGPFHTYRAFLDGPYGGMRRDLAAFDTCILIAGGSGVTALMSQLLNLIKRMRDGKAITRKVVVIWAIKRLEAMDWFREELRICRDSAPPRVSLASSSSRQRRVRIAEPSDDHKTDSGDDKPSDAFHSGEDTSAGRKREFHFPPLAPRSDAPHFNYAPPSPRRIPPPTVEDDDDDDVGDDTAANTAWNRGGLPVRAPELAHLRTTNLPSRDQARPTSTFGPPSGFEFGFSETPTEFRKSLMRFAFPVPHQIDGGWSVEYGRPDLGYMLREWARGGPDGRGILGRRTAVFVCGPATMREGVARTVARLQAEIWGDDKLEEIFLHTENYAL
ncbi:unnamed protein product [Parascedosporium putredinis]|uniref:ferric-chelate reductase (NADPH) n=1 Tax=Parascedosporium putredinis TaxID=1442378 RepID=A0A9P1GVT4_9PEZI|nr:unnamed protein product [Parascedosporium putredinis]CAI7988263.1 unnamed protein product [Parascedosporium putredinis]